MVAPRDYGNKQCWTGGGSTVGGLGQCHPTLGRVCTGLRKQGWASARTTGDRYRGRAPGPREADNSQALKEAHTRKCRGEVNGQKLRSLQDVFDCLLCGEQSSKKKDMINRLRVSPPQGGYETTAQCAA